MSWLDDALTWLKNLWEKDSNKILTTATVIGVGVVAVEGVKAGIQIEKARPLVEEEMAKKEEELGRPLKKTESMWMKTQMYFPAVVPLGIYSGLEILGIHINNKIAMDKIAGWKMVCAMKDKENKILKEEVSKVLSEKEQKKLEQSVNQRKLDDSGAKVPEKQLSEYANMMESGQFAKMPKLFAEPSTNQYFFSTDSEVIDAFKAADREIFQGANWTNINFALYHIKNAESNTTAGEVQGYTQKRNGRDGTNLRLERYVTAPNGLPACLIETDYGEKDYDLDGYSGDGAWNGRSRW